MTATLTKTLGSLDDFRGTLCVPGDPDYPRVRAIWNGQVAREPALIATCHDACDVRTVLRRAVDAGMVTAVRGGGHNVAGTALCDGGVVIDLRRRLPKRRRRDGTRGGDHDRGLAPRPAGTVDSR